MAIAESVMSKISTQAVSKAMEKADQAAQPSGAGKSFQEVLTQVDNSGNDMANMLGMNDVDPKSTQMQAVSGDGIDYTPGDAMSGNTGPDASRKLTDMLSEVNKGQMHMDNLVDQVLYSGKKLSPQELMVIQVHVHHWAQVTELTVKLADHGVSSVKAVLNTQVQ